jgi:hypothetical protein
MRNNSKVLALSGLVLASLSFGSLAADPSQTVQTAQTTQIKEVKTVTTLKMPQVMSFQTLAGMQALQYNLQRRHIDLRNGSLLAEEDQRTNDQTVQITINESNESNGDDVE